MKESPTQRRKDPRRFAEETRSEDGGRLQPQRTQAPLPVRKTIGDTCNVRV